MINAPLPFLAANLLQTSTIKHGFFGRKGGVSQGIYKGLNCGYGSDDAFENVDKNRELLCNAMNGSKGQIANPYQIHSNICEYIDAPFGKNIPKCDALVTKTKGIILGILTADCAPILFCDTKNHIIGAAHAGWQGAFSGIIENTIDIMLKNGAQTANIIAAIGPCINQESYEIGQEFYNRFIEQSIDNKKYFQTYNIENGKYLFNLKSYCYDRLKNYGIENIEILPHDTCALEEDFFSNRRRTKIGEADYGRNMSVIKLI